MDIKELLDNGFILYMGEYEKEFYDIVMKNNKDIKYIINDDNRVIIKKCWPNAGAFHAPDGKEIFESNILAFKLSEE